MIAASLALAPNGRLGANPFYADETPKVRAPSSGGALPGLQLGLRNDAAEAIKAFAEAPTFQGLVLLLGAAFLYGMLHAAGPGHRKTVVFSLFLGRKAAPWEPLAAGFLAAGVHGASGLAVVGALSIVRGAVAGLGQTEKIGSILDFGTFALVGLLALGLSVHKAVHFKRKHRHLGDGAAAKSLYGIVAVSSVVPCPGAVMLLLFALYAGQAWLGVVGIVSMSLGMGVVISAAGYLAYAGREGLFRRLKAKEETVADLSSGLELLSYLLLFGFSVYALSPWLTSIF